VAPGFCLLSETLNHLADSAEGAATLTADLVDLGFTKTIVAVTLNLIDREKSDIVVAVRKLASNIPSFCNTYILFCHDAADCCRYLLQ